LDSNPTKTGLVNQFFEAGKVRPGLNALAQLGAVSAAMRYFGEGTHNGKYSCRWAMMPKTGKQAGVHRQWMDVRL